MPKKYTAICLQNNNAQIQFTFAFPVASSTEHLRKVFILLKNLSFYT